MQDLNAQDSILSSSISATLYNTSAFPQELKSIPYWLLWKAQENENRTKILKIPVSGSSWPTQRVLFSNLPTPLPNQGYGFIYSAEHPYVCIDVDNATRTNALLVEALKSYSEWSPSQKGAHVIVQVDDKAQLIEAFGSQVHNKTEERDLYISSGYVTLTGRLLSIPQASSIRLIPASDLIPLLNTYFSKKNKLVSIPFLEDTNKDIQQQIQNISSARMPTQEKFTQNLIEKVLAALPVQYLPDNAFVDFPLINLDDPNPPEARTPWLIVGQALHDTYDGSLQGLMMWQNWSKKGSKYDEQAIMACWRSYSTAVEPRYTFATVLKLFNAQRPQYPDMLYKPDKPPMPLSTDLNISTYCKFARVRARYNVVTGLVETIFDPRYIPSVLEFAPTTHVISDIDFAASLLESEFIKQGFRDNSTLRKTRRILSVYAQANHYSPITDYFTNTLHPWDKRSRIPELVATISDSASHPEYAIYVRKWLIQVMAAVFTTRERPNQLNNVLILQGDQGVGKTFWVQSLFPPALRQYCISSKSIVMSQFRNDMVKLNMELTNTLICNINEIDTVFASKTFSEFKQFLDNTVDKIVLPYGATPTEVLRRTVFIGSTNLEQIFVDSTGNRRFMLIKSASFNYKHHIDLDQLWAEAYHLYQQGETWWLDPDRDKQVVIAQQEANQLAMAAADSDMLDLLDNTFDGTQPIARWQYYTFPRVKALLGLPSGKASSKQKDTLVHWLRCAQPKVSPAVLAVKPASQSMPWRYLCPPLRAET